MQRLRTWFFNYIEPNTLAILGLLVTAILFWFRLSKVPAGANPSEVTIAHNLTSNIYGLNFLFHNVINAPYNIGLTLFSTLHLHGIFVVRSLGALFGLISVAIFFYLIQKWYGTFVAILTSVIFADNFWLLVSTRDGGAISLYPLAICSLLISGYVLRRFTNSSIGLFIVVCLSGLMFYVPGMIVFVLLGLIWQYKNISAELKDASAKFQLLIAILLGIIVAPLIWSVYLHPPFIESLVGLPAHLNLRAFTHNLVKFPLQIFVYNFNTGSQSIGHLPELDIFSDVMFIIGVYAAWLRRKLDRSKLLIGGILLGWILTALGGSVSNIIVMPFIYVFIALGISYFIDQWFTVFPRNPVARRLAIGLVTLACLAVAIYHANQYFIAWPHSPSTTAFYSRDI